MFDIGFTEIVLVLIVGLLVVGPERMPVFARTITLWLGRIRQQWREVKKDIEQEIGTDEIKQQLHNEAILKSLGETRESIEEKLNTPASELIHTEDNDTPKNDTLDSTDKKIVEKDNEWFKLKWSNSTAN